MATKTKKQTFKRIIFRQEGELAERGLYAVEKTKDGDLRLFMDGNEVYTCQRVFHHAPLLNLHSCPMQKPLKPTRKALEHRRAPEQ